MKKIKIISILLLSICLLVSSHFIVYSIGVKQGFYSAGVTRSLVEFGEFSAHLNAQMANADCENLKNTLNEYISLLEKYKDIENPIMPKRVYESDMLFAYARLSLIEEKLGNETAAEECINIALELCKKQGWEDYSKENLFSWIGKLSEKNPIACLENI